MCLNHNNFLLKVVSNVGTPLKHLTSCCKFLKYGIQAQQFSNFHKQEDDSPCRLSHGCIIHTVVRTIGFNITSSVIAIAVAAHFPEKLHST